MLFSPEAHEAVVDEPWSADAARAEIAAIVADAEAAFDDGWPLHPDDSDEGDDPATRFRTVYLGGAGVVDALHRLERRGFVELQRDYGPYLERSLEAPADFAGDDPARSLWMGETGIRLVLQRHAPSQANLDRLTELIDANAQDERCELMWGSPGTILAGRELALDVSPSLDWLRARREPDGFWTQRLYGKEWRFVGPAHGFAGCVLALGEADGASDALRSLAIHDGDLVQWPSVIGTPLDAGRDGLIRTQWCHGSPGLVATLAPFLDEDLALGGGELTWHAGPLRKGANLCHGTGGNGYAFLALLDKTGDERWLARARAFATHAARQVSEMRSAHGRGRYTLWTGDPGTALYLADCVDGRGSAPIP